MVATTGRDSDRDDLHQLGVRQVVDHRRGDVAERVLEVSGGRGAQRVIEVDFGANLGDTLKAVADNGVIAAYASMTQPRVDVPFYDLMMRNITLRTVLVYDMPVEAKTAAIDDTTSWPGHGVLDHRFGPQFSLDEVIGAHEAVERGARGVVTVRS